MLRVLIDKGAYIDAVNNDRNSALIFTIVLGIRLKIRILCFSYFCKLSKIQYFFGEGFDKAAELLIEKGADVNIVGKNKQTALTWAAYSGKFLLF